MVESFSSSYQLIQIHCQTNFPPSTPTVPVFYRPDPTTAFSGGPFYITFVLTWSPIQNKSTISAFRALINLARYVVYIFYVMRKIVHGKSVPNIALCELQASNESQQVITNAAFLEEHNPGHRDLMDETLYRT